MLYELLSKPAKIILNIIGLITAGIIIYFHFQDRGPMHQVAVWIANDEGEYSATIAAGIVLLPLLAAEWAIIFFLDRRFIAKTKIEADSSKSE